LRKAFGQEPAPRDPLRFHNFPDLPDDESVVRGLEPESDTGFRRMDAVTETGPGEQEKLRQAIEIEKQQAREEGQAEGLEKGRQAVSAELEAVTQRLRQAYMDIERYRKQLYLKVEKEAVDLALAVARKIIGQEISVDRQIVLNVVKGALDKVIDHERVKIRINPQEMEMIQTAMFEFLPHVENLENVHFEPDAGITSGGCIVETDFGNIDARIENQLEQIQTAFDAEIEKSKYAR
jgi:flagellar assembly protein FliH